MNISQQFYDDIVESLSSDYKYDEVKDMIDTATFEETEDSVIVTYDNGVKDIFVKTIKVKLVHTKDLQKV